MTVNDAELRARGYEQLKIRMRAVLGARFRAFARDGGLTLARALEALLDAAEEQETNRPEPSK